MARRGQDLEYQIREIRKQLNEQMQCLEFRNEGKLSLLNELKDFFKKRGEVELEYAKNLERLCERFERNTKQRNIKLEVRSTFNLWSTLLAETRRIARDKANLAETLAAEMGARLDIMAKDVSFIARKCKEIHVDIQENMLKELKELNEQSKLYQFAHLHCSDAQNKLMKIHEKVEAAKNSSVRRRKAEEKEQEKLKVFNEHKSRLLKARNDYLLRLASSNARSLHYYSVDVMNIVQFMDNDYHESFVRLAQAYSDAEQTSCQHVTKATNSLLDQSKTLNFENDLHYFMSEFSNLFSQPPEFNFVSYGDDDVNEYKVNVKDAFLRAQEIVKNLSEEIKTLKTQTAEDSKTIDHMCSKNLKKYRVQTVDDALGLLEEAGEAIPPESASKSSPLDRGSLAVTTRAVQALHASQKGKEDTLSFTLGVFTRKLSRASQLNVSEAKVVIVDKSLSEQKVPPISIGGDYRIPKLFGGDCLEYIMATGLNIPLILSSCCEAILKEGVTTEGLFRVPGPSQQIEDLKKGFEEGRDPLAYSALRNIEITAVASVLKLYFRELKNPLFPSDKYYDFIKCCRREDHQDRLDAIQQTVSLIHPAICTVMRYLFKFLYDVSQHTADTKMNSANLAVVFGPTLTRAPDNADPRLLHNDVPAINVLIQLCIEHHKYFFGEDSEDDGLASPPPPPPPAETSILRGSPDTAMFLSDAASDDNQLHEEERESEEVLPTPEDVLPPSPEEDTVKAEHDENDIIDNETIVHVQPVEDVVITEQQQQEEEEEQVLEEQVKEEQVQEEQVQEEEGPVESVLIKEVKPIEEPPPGPAVVDDEFEVINIPEPSVRVDDDIQPPQGLSSQVSTVSVTGDINLLNQTLQDIEMSIEEMKRPTSTDMTPVKEEEDDDSDSDDEDDDDDEEMPTITARALYDYTARTEKEISFNKGDILEIIDKTRDGNWFDGVRNGKRGYIPVKYVEISEVPTAPEQPSPVVQPITTAAAVNVAVPPVPERKSSIKAEEISPQTIAKDEQVVKMSSVDEEESNDSLEVKKVGDVVKSEVTPVEEPPVAAVDESPKRRVPVKTGAVSKLTQQFQQPPPQPAPPSRVLVGPHKTSHVRNPSGDQNKVSQDIPPRSNSSGNKPRPVYTAPPTKPKPMDTPTASPFPLMSHDTHVSASPLQKAHLQGQGQVRPPQPPSVASKKGSVFRSSGKKDKPPVAVKPAVPPSKPAGGGSAQLQAELLSAVKRKRPDEEAS